MVRIGLKWFTATLLCVGVKSDDYTLIQIKPKNEQTESITICAAFNGEDYGFRNMSTFPTSAYHSDLTVDFDDFYHKGPTYTCKNSTIPIEKPRNGSYVLVQRGNCRFQEKAEEIKRNGGGGLITVNNESSIFVPGPSDNSSVNLGMFVAIIGKNSYEMMEVFAAKSNGWHNLRGSMYVPESSKFDPTLIPVWLIAVSCITLGTLLSGHQAMGHPRRVDRQQIDKYNRNSITSIEINSNQIELVRVRSNSTPTTVNTALEPSSKKPDDENIKIERNSNSSDSRVIIDADSDVEYAENDANQFTSKNAGIWLIVTTAWLMLLYFLYDYLVYIMIGIFCIFGASAMATVIYTFILINFECTESVTCPTRDVRRWKLCDFIPQLFCRSGFPVTGVVLGVFCLSLSLTWFIFRHSSWAWILQDIIGYFFCIFTISELHLPNFKLLTLLLVGFCVYDVFMVYITPFLTPDGDSVMVSVATGGSNPEKLPFLFLVPHLAVSELHSVCNIGLSYSMLGFGDIIIPGFLGGYCAYFDLLNVHAHYYYWWTFIFSYGFGLILTFVALILMATGQPALFFLVPSTVGSLLLCAYVRKETTFFWNGPKLKESLN